jgi:integration host factor subunit beta
MAARLCGLIKNDTDLAVNSPLTALSNAFAAGEHIEIRGFGSVSVNHRPGRIGCNPRNGDCVAVSEKRVVHFKP